MFISQLIDTSPDLNVENLEILIAQYTGFRFLFDSWFVSDLYFLNLFILYTWVGVYLVPQLQIEKEKGYGNLLAIRLEYKERVKNLLLSQSLYIFSIIFITTIVSFFVAIIVGGTSFNGLFIGIYTFNLIQSLVLIFIQILWISIIVIVINAICLLSNYIIENKYALQALPVFIFAFLPIVTATTIGNISDIFARSIIYFVPWEMANALHYVIQENFNFIAILLSIMPIIFGVLLISILYWGNTKKYSRDYL